MNNPFKKKKDESPKYEVTHLGSLNVEVVQMPHSLHKADGSEYNIITWIYRLRVGDKQVLFDRQYTCGEEEDLKQMSSYVRFGEIVDGQYQAEYQFMRELAGALNQIVY